MLDSTSTSEPISDSIDLALEILATPGIIGIDCETTIRRAIDRQICTLQVAHEDMRKAAVYIYDQPEKISVLMEAISKSPGTLVAHNAIFEWEVFMNHGGHPQTLLCTMIAAKVLQGRIDNKTQPPSFALKAVAARDLDLILDKEVRERDWRVPMDQEAYDYAMLDAVAARNLWILYGYQFEDDPESLQGYHLITDALPGIACANLTGLGFDRGAHKVMVAQQQQECEDLLMALSMICDERIQNHGSPSMVSKWIAEQISFEVGCTPRRAAMLFTSITGEAWPISTTGFSLDKHVVERVLPTVSALWPRVALYLSVRAVYQKIAKLLQAFGPTLDEKLDEGDIIRCSLIPHGAKTSRMSAREPNLQQIPKDLLFRAMFIARPGRKLVLADYSQIELRVGCLIADDRIMQQVFADGKDIHSATAENIHKIVYDKTNPQHVKWRKDGKPVTFAALYGAMASTIAMNSGLGIAEASDLLEAWLDAYPGIRKYREEQPGRAREAEYIRLISGQKIVVDPTARDPQLINAPVQGSSASVMYKAVTYVYYALRESGLDAKIALVVHDEILLDASEEDAPAAAEILQREMTRALVELYPQVRHLGMENVADASVVDSWAEKD